MPRIPYRRQANDWYCGPAVLQMVLAGFGVKASQPALARASGTNARHGTTRAGLVRVMRAKGFRVAARHGSSLARLAETSAAGRAVIVLYREREGDAHYAVFLGANGNRVTLHDPWHGPRYALPRAEFLRRWHGTARRWPRWAMIIDRKAAS